MSEVRKILDTQSLPNQLMITSDTIDEMLDVNQVPIDIDLRNLKLSTAWTFARYKLDANQSKILRFLISHIQPEDENFKTYYFSIKELSSIFGIKEKGAYTEIPKATAKMLGTVIEFKSDENRLIQINLLSVADYEKGTLKIKFNPVLKPVLIKLKDEISFSYKLNEVMSFSCGYSFRWFDILKTMEKEGETHHTFFVSEIRNIFKISDDEYVKHTDFRKRVIEPPYQELKERSNIWFEYTEERVGKRVEKIIIELNRQKDQVAT